MSGANTKAMEEALEAAVARMGKPAEPPRPAASSEPLAMLAAILPKLIESHGERSAAQKIDSLREEDLQPLRDQMRTVRRRLHQITKTQAEILGAVESLRQQQTVIGDAVLELVNQMARVRIVEESDQVPEPWALSPRRAHHAASAGTGEKAARRTRRSETHE
jgi:hypothetical protein